MSEFCESCDFCDFSNSEYYYADNSFLKKADRDFERLLEDLSYFDDVSECPSCEDF